MSPNQSNGNNHTVRVEMRGRRSVVAPGHVQAKKEESITWETSDTDVSLFFPDKSLFGKHVVTIKKGGKVSEKVDANCKNGRYLYAAYCNETDDFAEGGSFPVIIIR